MAVLPTEDIVDENDPYDVLLLEEEIKSRQIPRCKSWSEFVGDETKLTPGTVLTMRFQRNPQRLAYCYDDGPWQVEEIQPGNGIDQGTKCAPHLDSQTPDPVTVTKVCPIAMEPGLLKSNMTYLVTNDLEVKEMTTLLCLLQEHDVRDISTFTDH